MDDVGCGGRPIYLATQLGCCWGDTLWRPASARAISDQLVWAKCWIWRHPAWK